MNKIPVKETNNIIIQKIMIVVREILPVRSAKTATNCCKIAEPKNPSAKITPISELVYP